ncbi:hypothetical protein MRX96_057212 [Rhipicephalus microplus]
MGACLRYAILLKPLRDDDLDASTIFLRTQQRRCMDMVTTWVHTFVVADLVLSGQLSRVRRVVTCPVNGRTVHRSDVRTSLTTPIGPVV